MLSLAALSLAMPVDDDKNTESNWLYQQINEVLKRDIEKHTNSSDSLEVGDKIKDNHGFSINIQQFGAGNDFPVHFRPQDSSDHPDVLKNATVVVLVDDFDGSSEFVIHQNSSEESSEESKESKDPKTTPKVTSASSTTTSDSSTTNTPSTTAHSTSSSSSSTEASTTKKN